MINKNTNLYISIAANPGNIGANFYNKKFKTNSLNSIYLPIKPNSNIKNLKSTLKFLNIKGCSVSMPYKKKVISILDNVEKVAKKLQSVNTIVQKNGKLIGYNTDAYSISTILKGVLKKKNQRVLIVGNGAMARVFVHYLSHSKFVNSIYLTSRSIKKNNYKFYNKKRISFIDWKKKKDIDCDLFINATPLGMIKYPIFPINQFNFDKSHQILDVVALPDVTNLCEFAKKNRIKYIGGKKFASLQADKQYEIYSNLNKSLTKDE